MSNVVQDGRSYGGLSQHHSFETDGGFAICPIAGRTPGFRRIRLHGGFALRRVRWSANRTGKPPFIPSATNISTTDLLLSHTVTPSLPAPNSEVNGYEWHVEGEYLYVQVTPRIAGVDALPTGGFPFPVAPMDATANSLAGPVINAFGASLGAAAATTITPGVIYNALGVKALQGTDYVWPFTAIPAAFTSSSLFGA